MKDNGNENKIQLIQIIRLYGRTIMNCGKVSLEQGLEMLIKIINKDEKLKYKNQHQWNTEI